jgi:Uma2 family endonuclease
MVAAVATVPTLAPLPEPSASPEGRVLLHGVTWKDYVVIRDVLDDHPGIHLTYLEGRLEIMSPSSPHELWKTNIARLVELYAHVKRIPLHGYGSTTFKKESAERGAEPDECYLIGKKLSDYPEIALEVIHTSPLIDKLRVFAGFGIAEVWVFKNGAFTLYALDATRGAYEVRPSSERLPGLDFAMVARYAVREDAPEALWEFEAEIRR